MSLFVSLFHLFEAVEKIEGKLRMQKIVHLLQECGNAPFERHFELARFGAFSSGLAADVEAYRDDELLDTEEVRCGNFPTLSYSKSAKYDAVFAKLEKPESQPVWAELARQLNEKKTRELEAVSTVVFLRRKGLDGVALKERFEKLKPHLKDIFEDSLTTAEALLARALN